MVLADTSIWIDHFRRGSPLLIGLLDRGQVLTHPAVIGELACGTLRQRRTTIDLLERLPTVTTARDGEVLRFLEMHRLFGCGLGWTDVHLLAGAALTPCRLWTGDRQLVRAAQRLKLAFEH